MEPYGSSILNSSLSKEITSHCFLKKFVIPSFECYSGATDSIQYLRQYQDKMTVHSLDNLRLSHVFSFSHKGVAYDWFNSLSRQTLWSFEEVK